MPNRCLSTRYVVVGLLALWALTSSTSAHEMASNGRVAVEAQIPLPNVPGKSLVTVVVDYPPGGATPPHTHAGSAFIYARVLEGSIRSRTDSLPERVYQVGESWVEAPGAHHLISANGSQTQPAKLLAVFVVDNEDQPLTRLDQR